MIDNDQFKMYQKSVLFFSSAIGKNQPVFRATIRGYLFIFVFIKAYDHHEIKWLDHG